MRAIYRALYQATKSTKLTINCQDFGMRRLTGKDQRAALARQLDSRSKGFIWPYVRDLGTADLLL